MPNDERKHSILKNNLNIINNNERPKYESILNKWYDGKFESAVEDFREIHYLRSGTKQIMEGSKLAKKLIVTKKSLFSISLVKKDYIFMIKSGNMESHLAITGSKTPTKAYNSSIFI